MAENNLTSNELYFQQEEDEQGINLTLEENLQNNLVGLIEDRFLSAENARDLDESRWLTAYHNYRGLYGKNIRFRESEKSRVFVKITKTKVLASFGQIIEVLFSQGKFPLGVSPTSVPEDISKLSLIHI